MVLIILIICYKQQSFDYKKICIYDILESYLNQYNKNNLYYTVRLDEE